MQDPLGHKVKSDLAPVPQTLPLSEEARGDIHHLSLLGELDNWPENFAPNRLNKSEKLTLIVHPKLKTLNQIYVLYFNT